MSDTDRLAHDYLDLDSLFTAEELALRDRVRAFVARADPRRTSPRWYEAAHFPRELVTEMGALGLLGMHLTGYGCAGRSAVEYGLAALELEAGDSGLRTFVSVQGSLAMSAHPQVRLRGAEAAVAARDGRRRADRLLRPDRADRGQRPGEHDHRAPPGRRRLGARPARSGGSGWPPSPTSRSSGRTTDEGIRGFVVPTETPGFTATPIEPKLSMRASIQCDITLDGVRLPADAVLPGVGGLKGPFSCLNEARYGIMWGAMGAARDAYEAALAYALAAHASSTRRSPRSSSPSRSSSTWCWRSRRGSWSRCRPGGSRTPASCSPEQISFGKLNNVREAIEICREARTILGGNGITLDYSPLRHANNLESVRTYEGTDEVHTLIMGQAHHRHPGVRTARGPGQRDQAADDRRRSSSSARARWARRSRMVCALAGYRGHRPPTSTRTRWTARADQLRQAVDRDVEKGRRTRADVDAAFGRLAFSTDLDAAAADGRLRDRGRGGEAGRQAARSSPTSTRSRRPHAILATNSSTIVSSRLADATGRPDRVCQHALLQPGAGDGAASRWSADRRRPTATVETDRRAGPAARQGAGGAAREIPGFVANRILGAVRDEAIFLLEQGVASVEDIDTACRTALGYPMGPFELMDLTGIDIGYHAKLARYAESRRPARPAQPQRRGARRARRAGPQDRQAACTTTTTRPTAQPAGTRDGT